jgi:tripartite-type tricarboxylate transporter receptor subunit TctC
MKKNALNIAMVMVAMAGFAAVTGAVAGDAYPVRPVRWIMPFLPGSITDGITRAVGQHLAEVWKVPVIVDNRSGAGGMIGAELAAKSPADGYTLCTLTTSHSVAMVRPGTAVDLGRDFAMISQMTSQPYALAVPASLPARNLGEFIALARQKPDYLNYGTSGTGGIQHLGWEMFSKAAGVQMVHIPYKGGAAVHTELLAGAVHAGFVGIMTTAEYVKAGRLRYLAVTSAKRVKTHPDLPTVAESGVPGFQLDAWYGVVAPAKTPKATIDKINSEVVRALQRPEVRNRFEAGGVDLVGSSPEAFTAFVRTEVDNWRALVRKLKIKLER